MKTDPPEPPDDGDNDGVQTPILYAIAIILIFAAYAFYRHLKPL